MGPTFRRLVAFCLLLVLILPAAGLRAGSRISPSTPRGGGREGVRDVVINEVAWSGTAASATDEWIELYNNTAAAVPLGGWHLVDDDDLDIPLNGEIGPFGYYLIERSDDNTVRDIPADWTGSFGSGLSNTGEALTLTDSLGSVVDTANGDGGGWPAGDNTADKHTMERIAPFAPDANDNWGTNNGIIRNGHDANGTPLNGTPKLRNSVSAPAADLFVNTSAPAQVTPGAQIRYSIHLGNWGNLAAAPAVLTDTLPAGVSFVTQTSAYSLTQPAPGTLVWDLGTIPFTLTAFPITVTGSVALTATGILVNHLQATTAITEVTTANNQAQASTIVVQTAYPDLAVAKAGPGTTYAGAIITYTLAFSSAGELAAAGVHITDTLPAGVTWITYTSSLPLTWNGSTTAPAFDAGTLASGVSGRIAIGVQVDTVPPGTELANRVDAGCTGEITLTNNTAWFTTTVQVHLPDLAVAKSGPGSVHPGDILTYTLAVANAGTEDAPNVRITDTLPAGVAFLTQESSYPLSFDHPTPHTLAWTAASLPVDTLARITVTGQVSTTTATTLTNTLAAATTAGEITTANNTATWTTTVSIPATGHVVINEFVAKGTEWVELYNPLDDAVDIGGWHLASEVGDSGGTLAYTVSLGTFLPSRGYYVANTGGFFLSNDGDRIHLYDAAMSEIDAVGYGIRGGAPIPRSGDSAARVPNGYDSDDDARDWNIAATATKEAANNAPPVALGTTVVLNEMDNYPGTGQPDRVEIYNPTAGPVVLTGWLLSDGDAMAPIVTAVSVPVLGWAVLAEGTDWTTSMDFTDNDVAYLFQPDGTRVDQIGWYDQQDTAGTFQRICDGDGPHDGYDWTSSGGNVTWYELPPTLGSSNCAPWPIDAAISKDGPGSTAPGQVITYTLLYRMTTVHPCAALQITDTLPAGTALVTFTAAPGVVWNGSRTQPAFAIGAVYGESAGQLQLGVRVSNTVSPGTELVNRAAVYCAGDVTATNDLDQVTTTVKMAGYTEIYMPALCKSAVERVKIDAVLYDGYQYLDKDEAVRLINWGTVPVDLQGWSLCKDNSGELSCKTIPPAVLPVDGAIWLARNAISFTASFGFAPDYEMSDWPALTNAGDELLLRDPRGAIVDAMVYGNSTYAGAGWIGPPLDPYYAGDGAMLQRIRDEATGRPIPDTDTAADWMQDSNDPAYGRRAVRPGWDLDAFSQPLAVTEPASLTVAIAPDNAAEVLLAAIAQAQESIEAELYVLEQYDIVMALVAKAQQGKRVTVLLEGGPAGGMSDQQRWACQTLGAAGGQCWFMFSWNDPAGHADVFDRYDMVHSKIVLFDRRWAIITSQNLTGGGLPADDKSDGTWGSRGVLVLTNAPSVVARAAAILDADLDPAHYDDVTPWGSYGFVLTHTVTPIVSSGGTTSTVAFPAPLATSGWIGFELLTAPESALRHSDALLGLLARAAVSDTVDVEQMYEYSSWGTLPTGSPAPNLRLEAYIEAARRGARVRLLLNRGSFGDFVDLDKNVATLAYVNSIAICQGLDLQARLGDPTQYGIHNKMVLASIGGEGYAHIGSINGSESSNKLNREVALQIRSNEVHSYLGGMFEWDWSRSGHVLVSEVLYNPVGTTETGFEWVELYNPTTLPIDLSSWKLGDALTVKEYGSGIYSFPVNTSIPAHGLLVIAAQAADFESVYGFAPDYEFLVKRRPDDPDVPNMRTAGDWEGFGFALGNEGDEVALWTPTDEAVDVLVYCNGSYPCGGAYPGVLPFVDDVEEGHSLERRPPDLETDNCGFDFFDASPSTPGTWPAGYPGCK